MALTDILNKPIRWLDWDTDKDLLAFLADLQANILKGHGRDHTANMLLHFPEDMTPAAIKDLLLRLSFLTTSALEQLRAAETFKLTGVSGGRIFCIFLARGAYKKMQVPEDEIPPSPAFRAGMRDRGQLDPIQFNGFAFAGMADPLPNAWEETGPWSPDNPEPDAMILIGSDSDADISATVMNLQSHIVSHSAARVIGIDIGLAQRRTQKGATIKGEGIEHFGYVDGISQPLFLMEDIEEIKSQQGIDKWNPTCVPSQFIVADPSKCTDVAAGSYFVYRKLEQNVKRFKEQEEKLALSFPSAIPNDRAGALVVGRYEDGTPLMHPLFPQQVAGNPLNNFNYDTDQVQTIAQCPFRAHIRKTNPRTMNGEVPASDDLGRLMARRGITYGKRKDRPKGADFDPNDRPEAHVGLIFMAYMADITEQFEFTQSVWAGNVDFPPPQNPVGTDVVIGQRPNTLPVHKIWHDKASNQNSSPEFGFQTSIRLVGGEYFFAPSISFLQRGPQLPIA